MRYHPLLVVLVSFFASLTTALVLTTKPPAFFLAGDSTTASINAARTGGGWGDGFLETLKNGAVGWNLGHNGATTVSYRANGNWTRVLDSVSGNKTKYSPFVTIQFGHNDQLAFEGISVAQYTANLVQFGRDVRNAGGEPILVTPISRRAFNSSGVVIEDLAAQAAATKNAANTLGAQVVDLNKASTDFLNDRGSDFAKTLNLSTNDYTHLNEYGRRIFGRMVSLLMDNLPGGYFKQWTWPRCDMSQTS